MRKLLDHWVEITFFTVIIVVFGFTFWLGAQTEPLSSTAVQRLASGKECACDCSNAQVQGYILGQIVGGAIK